MADSGAKGRWGQVLRYVFGVAVCVLAGINVLIGSAWYLCLGVAVVGVGIIYGSVRRIFRAGVSRTGDEIVCRYIPWFEGNVYLFNGLIPLLGVALVAAGYAPGGPAWLRYGGIALLCISGFFLISNVSMWRRSFLCFTTSTLRVHGTEGARDWADIRRDRVQSIEPKLVAYGSTKSLQAEIAYLPTDVDREPPKTVALGPRLTVQPANLLNALVAWKDGANANPNELLDRVEEILRGRSTTQM